MKHSIIKTLNDICSYVIFKDGEMYFIPGRREDETVYADDFDNLTTEYVPSTNHCMGAGWFFDKAAIETLKKDFEVQYVPYAEISISDITLRRP